MQTSHGCIALNPDVTEATVAQTICVLGYTATIRPSTTYTNGVKAKLLEEAGQDRSQMGAYELDHIIPLAAGGHPRKLSNLALQPWYGENSATEKDGFERRLQHMICNGEISLTDAQFCIAEDWHGCQAEIAAGGGTSYRVARSSRKVRRVPRPLSRRRTSIKGCFLHRPAGWCESAKSGDAKVATHSRKPLHGLLMRPCFLTDGSNVYYRLVGVAACCIDKQLAHR